MKRTLLMIISLFFMSACVYTQNTYQKESNNIDKQKMVQIETGKTDKQWIIANLGMPDRIQSNQDGTEIYEYVNERKVNSDKRFIFLFSINSEKVIAKRTLSVAFKNNIVNAVNTQDE